MKKTVLKTAIWGSVLFSLSFTENPTTTTENNTKLENQLSISATKMNVLYIGLENPLDIAIPNVNSEQISVSIDNGTIEKKSGVEWVARVVRSGVTKIQVYVEKEGKKTLYGTKEFRALRVPNPEPKIRGSQCMSIDKQSILQNPKLEIFLDNFQYDDNFFKITSFTFLYSNQNSTKEVNCTANNINQEALDLIKKSNSGDVLTFADIKITDVTGTTRTVSPMTLKVK